jgi:hypothetical protein
MSVYAKVGIFTPKAMDTLPTKNLHYLGKCRVKGCNALLRITVPMVGIKTREYPFNGPSYERTKWVPSDPFGRYWTPSHLGIECVKHHGPISFTPINGKYSAQHQCDARCLNALGPNCECSCGGENHGRGHQAELIFTIDNKSQ